MAFHAILNSAKVNKASCTSSCRICTHHSKQTITTPLKYLKILKIMGPSVNITVITGCPTSTVTLQNKNFVSYKAENGYIFF
jgi:hypothetical protein